MRFEKVSYEKFSKDIFELYDGKVSVDGYVQKAYNKIIMPRRSTEGSAGYDFFMPFDVDIYKGTSIIIPTGIKAYEMDIDSVLLICPRSGQGFKYRVCLANTVGVIDADYSNPNNEGHIMIKLCYDGFNSVTEINDSNLTNKENLSLTTSKSDSPTSSILHLSAGDRFCQGIFVKYLITENDSISGSKRTGGFGSTGN